MVGVLVEAFSMWLLGHLTPMSNESDAQVALIFSRIGIGLLMLSVTVAGVANLKPAVVGQGTGLLGLARQLGGSFGIAIASTYVVDMTQFHRYDLSAKLFQGRQDTNDRINMLAGAFHVQGMDLSRAHDAALAAIDQQITGQASTMAFNNTHILIGLLFAAAFPILFLMKRASGGGDIAAH